MKWRYSKGIAVVFDRISPEAQAELIREADALSDALNAKKYGSFNERFRAAVASLPPKVT
jgi:hypothetical protein